MKSWIVVASVIGLASTAAAQVQDREAYARSLTLTAGPCVISSGTATPSGGATCDVYLKSDGTLWVRNGSVWLPLGTNFWQRTGTVLSPAMTGDDVAIDHNLGVGGTSTLAGNTVTIDSVMLQQRAAGQTTYRTEWYPTGSNGAVLNSYAAGGGYLPLLVGANPLSLTNGGLHVGGVANPGANNLWIYGNVQGSKTSYASQTSGWRIDADGGADFRYLYTDQLRAKAFVVDLEQALAGGQIVSKSVAKIAQPFTVPPSGNTATLIVEDLPSAAGIAAFQPGDTVRLRTFTRSAGALDISNAWGSVSGYADFGGGKQSWTFTRSSTFPGAMTAGTSIPSSALALDYGVTGNGLWEVSATDGSYASNAPYAQVATWSSTATGTEPTVTTRARLGNLHGITGVTEYGLFAGDLANARYLRLTDANAEIKGIPLKLFSGSTQVARLSPFAADDATLAPNFSMGNPAPTDYSTGTGCWSGIDSGVFKWRCGTPGGYGIWWTGTNLTVNGDIQVQGFVANDTANVNGIPSSTVASGAARANLGLSSTGGVTLPVAAAPSGSGLFLGSDKMGFYSSSAWRTYMDSSGNFVLGNVGGGGAGLSWNQSSSTLTIRGSVAITGGTNYAASSSVGGAASNTDAVGSVPSSTIAGWRYGSGTYIDGGQLQTGTVTTSKLNFTPVQSSNVVASINASGEGIRIAGSRINIDGNVTFGSGYDPSTKETPSGAQARADAAQSAAASDATSKMNSRIANGGAAADVNANTTTISGGKITTGSLDANRIVAGSITADRLASDLVISNTMRSGGAASFGSGSGYYLSASGTPVFRVGDPGGQRVQWDGYDLGVYGAHWSLTSGSGLMFEYGNPTRTDNAVNWTSGAQVGSDSNVIWAHSPNGSGAAFYNGQLDFSIPGNLLMRIDNDHIGTYRDLVADADRTRWIGYPGVEYEHGYFHYLDASGSVTTNVVDAHTYATHTPWPDGQTAKDALALVTGIRADADGKLDHATLPEYARISLPRRSIRAKGEAAVGASLSAQGEVNAASPKRPELVTEYDDGLNLGNLVSLLTVAMQQQQAQIAELQKQLAALQEKR